MSKGIVLGIGSTGVVGASVSSYFGLKPTTETFRVKYKNALLSKEGDSSIGDSRHASLSGKTPIYKKLKEAVTNHSSSDLSKRLHKEACLEIYEMPIDEEKYFSDFESYCTKNMGDLIAPKTFITDPKNTATEGDKKLNLLKELGSDKLETLNSALKTLKNAIGSASPSETHRETLKGGCDNMKTKIFVGGNDAGFQNFRDYCAK